jgi:squalene-associated FAD-dependent desaturase
MKVAVVGGGWAGLAAAVRATEAGHAVTLFEMSQQLGGRARTVEVAGRPLDNGQHILIGAYQRTLALMATLGVDERAHLDRRPLELRYPDGRGLRMPRGPAWLGFGRAVLGCAGWSANDRMALTVEAARWAWAGFRCDPALTVDALCTRLPPAVRELLIDPLCVAALNTPAREASAAVLLRVLRDALFGGAGSADLLLPRKPLGELLPQPAARWLQAQAADIRLGSRIERLQAAGASWLLGEEAFDQVILACTATEAARLAQPLAPGWAQLAQGLRYEPIVTVYLQAAGARLPAAMTALLESPEAPAQYAFDHGALGATPGVFAFVISGAAAWVERGLPATGKAVLRQAMTAFAPSTWPNAPAVLRVLAEKRATFRCTPGLARPQMGIAPGLMAAGDYIAGPYPATLEGAVRSGEAAAAALASHSATARQPASSR